MSALVNLPFDMHPICAIDNRDRIAFVNEAWVRFMEPCCPEAASDDIVGRPVWELIPDGPLRLLWEVMYRRVRAMGAQLFVPMRIDTLRERRLVEIELRPCAEGSIQHIFERIWSEARPPVALLDRARARDERTLHSCAWCSRIEVGRGIWQEIETAQAALALGAAATLPTLAPAACTTCKQSILKTFPSERWLGPPPE